MPAPFHDIEIKVEAALKAVVETVSLANRGNALVHTGLSADDLTLPYIVCVVEEVLHQVIPAGNYIATALVAVHSSANDDNLTVHRSRVAYVRDALQDDGLANTLSAAVLDFDAISAIIRATNHFVEERKFIAEMRLDIACVPTDLV